MSPFGGCLLLGGPEYTIKVGIGKPIRFEMHSYCGPMPTRQLGHNHPFWTAVTLWSQQGERVDGDGLCIWGPATGATGKEPR